MGCGGLCSWPWELLTVGSDGAFRCMVPVTPVRTTAPVPGNGYKKEGDTGACRKSNVVPRHLRPFVSEFILTADLESKPEVMLLAYVDGQELRLLFHSDSQMFQTPFSG